MAGVAGYKVLRVSNAQIEKDLAACITHLKAFLPDRAGLAGDEPPEEPSWREWTPPHDDASSSERPIAIIGEGIESGSAPLD